MYLMGHENEGLAALLQREYARNTQMRGNTKGHKYPSNHQRPSLRKQLSENDGENWLLAIGEKERKGEKVNYKEAKGGS